MPLGEFTRRTRLAEAETLVSGRVLVLVSTFRAHYTDVDGTVFVTGAKLHPASEAGTRLGPLGTKHTRAAVVEVRTEGALALHTRLGSRTAVPAGAVLGGRAALFEGGTRAVVWKGGPGLVCHSGEVGG